MNILAFDPGNTTGWATFYAGKLFQARAEPYEDVFAVPPSAVPPDVVLIEIPRVYPRGGKGDQNDLIDLAIRVGELRGLYRTRGLAVELVAPRTWKGTVPKDIHNLRVLARLSGNELSVLPRRSARAKTLYDHNCLDAVGLGLWKLGRL